MQDISKANIAVQFLPDGLDTLSQSFMVVLKQLFTVSSQLVPGCNEQSEQLDDKKPLNPQDIRSSANDIFGNQEIDLLNNQALAASRGLDFSQWLNL